MHRFAGIAILTLLGASALPARAPGQDGNTVAGAASANIEHICGWFDNPTPSNVWLIDRHAQWTIGIQGGYQAQGEWPQFPRDKWVITNAGSYGYGCACLKVTLDKARHRVIRIYEGEAKPLKTCRRDKAIRDLEPWHPDVPYGQFETSETGAGKHSES